MLMFTRRLGADSSQPATATATLPLDTRIKSRARIQLDDGSDAAFVLERGLLLRGGEKLTDDNGTHIVQIVAADETVSTVRCADALLLTRAAYHLGNRHVPLQIGQGFVRYQHDHVLDDMVRQMDKALAVAVEQAPFEPEAGAYQSAPHSHGHSHSHGHAHDEAHAHAHHH